MATWVGGSATFARQLRGSKGAAKRVAKRVVKKGDIKAYLQKNYIAGKDPYSHTWKKRKGSYPWPIMRRTGQLYKSLKVGSTGPVVWVKRAGSGVDYHQSGTKYMAQRLVVPIVKKGMPKRIQKTINKEARIELQRLFKK
jgi:phage gpG-like protein